MKIHRSDNFSYYQFQEENSRFTIHTKKCYNSLLPKQSKVRVAIGVCSLPDIANALTTFYFVCS